MVHNYGDLCDISVVCSLVVYDVSEYHKVELCNLQVYFFCADALKHRFELQQCRTKDMRLNGSTCEISVLSGLLGLLQSFMLHESSNILCCIGQMCQM